MLSAPIYSTRELTASNLVQAVATVIHCQALAVKNSKHNENSVRQGCEDYKFYKIKTIAL
jgi:hypothetical protein